MKFSIPPGVFDILPSQDPKDWHSSYLWEYLETTFRKTARSFGFKEIRTPAFERTELFIRGVGEETDIVSKEMYTFEDKGNRSMTLRPEGTASVMRSFIENHKEMPSKGSLFKVFYFGPMFRYERAQAGRYRQHHQGGAEIIGNDCPEQDVELIDFIFTFYRHLKLQNLHLKINNLGDKDCREKFKSALLDYLKDYSEKLSNDSQRRFVKNPLRILDSKDPTDKEIIKNAPSILDFLNSADKDRFEKTKSLLDELSIKYTVDDKLVRGLDYYNHLVFEVVSNDLGAQNSLAGGGRYNGLLKQLDGPDLPTIGFGTGFERILQTMLAQNVQLPSPYRPTIFFIPLGQKGRSICFSLTHYLRQQNVSAEMDLLERKINKAMQHANNINAKYVCVIGDNEVETGTIELKEMISGTVSKLPISSLLRVLTLEQNNENYLNTWNEISKPFTDQQEAKFFLAKIEEALAFTTKTTTDLQNTLAELKKIID